MKMFREQVVHPDPCIANGRADGGQREKVGRVSRIYSIEVSRGPTRGGIVLPLKFNVSSF